MKKDRYFSNEEDIVRVLYEFSTLAGYGSTAVIQFVRMLRSLRFAAVQSRQVGTAARSFATVRPFKVLGVQQIAVGGLDKVSKECNMIHST